MVKKGIIGFDTVKVVIVSLLIIAVLAIASFAAITPLNSVANTVGLYSGTETNESGYVNATGYTLAKSTLTNFASPTITAVYNTTNGSLIGSNNYVLTGNILYNNTVTNWANVKVSYTYQYNTPAANSVIGNTTVGFGNFFSQVPTIMTLLAVIVLILIIAIVIVAVTRFQSGKEEGL